MENKEETKVEEAVTTEEVAETPSAQTKETPVADKKKACKEKICELWGKQKKTIIAVIVLLVLVGGSYAYAQYYKKIDVGQVAIKARVQKFVTDNIQPGTNFEVKDVTKDGDLYKVTVSIQKQDVPLYVTRDGKKLIEPQGIHDMDAKPADKTASQNQPAEKTVADTKQDVPDVRLFVMSYCPYGTQMEKGILPVLKTLGSKIKFSLEFVDYSMHNNKASNDRKELDENLRQYCIQKNQPAKLNTYLTCFLKKGQGTEASCLAQAGVNASQVSSCMKQADDQFNVTKDFNDQSTYKGQFPTFEVNAEDNTKYGVQGSPTLVINGTQVSAQRDSASLLKAICSGFTNAPKECSAALSATAPAPGFGEGTASGSSASAGCASPTN